VRLQRCRDYKFEFVAKIQLLFTTAGGSLYFFNLKVKKKSEIVVKKGELTI